MRDRHRIVEQRNETKMLEALQSPKWDNKVVAEHSLRWLKERGHVNGLAATSTHDAVGEILHRMLLDGQFATSICSVLDLWKAWSDNAGMRKSDFQLLKQDTVVFAQATVFLAGIKDVSSALQGSLCLDLQECLKMWRVVRLG